MYDRDMTIFETFKLQSKGIADARKSAITCVLSEDEKKVETVISAFIAEELFKMRLNSKRIFLSRPIFVFLLDEGGKKHCKLMRLSNALIEIEKCLNELLSKIKDLQEPYDMVIENINAMRENASQNGATHLVCMYEDDLAEEESKRNKICTEQFKSIEFLLNEKTRILQRGFNRMEKVESKYFFRIQKYYNAACERNKRLPIMVLGMRNYEDRIDMSFFEKYHRQLEQAQNKLAKLNSQK